MKLENIIYELIESKREGEYWDFKEEHHQNKADLLHDILCFSNSLHDGIRYIIIGVVDGTYEISGCCNLSTRRKQSDLIDFLRSKKFAGGYRPDVEIRTITIESKELDIIIIKDSNYTPFYITEDYRNRMEVVKANNIYTRVGDTNTPKNASADFNIVEKLWRKRFGLDLLPLDKLHILLKQPEAWEIDFGNKNYTFHQHSPEFRLEHGELKEGYEPYCAFYPDKKALFGPLYVYFHSTILYETELWTGDEARIFLPKATVRHFIGHKGKEYWYYSYTLNSIEGKLLRVFNKNMNLMPRGGSNVHFLIFPDEHQRERFEAYLNSNKEQIEQLDVSAFRYQIDRDKRIGGRVFSAEKIVRVYLMYKSWKEMR